jgi:hypothetical protein
LSGYFGIYDTVIIVPAAMLTANAMKQANLAGRRPLTPAFHTLLAIIYVTTWMTQPMAWLIGLQPYTVALAALAVYLLYVTNCLLNRSTTTQCGEVLMPSKLSPE